MNDKFKMDPKIRDIHSCSRPSLKQFDKKELPNNNKIKETVLYEAIEAIHEGDNGKADLVGPMIEQVNQIPVYHLSKMVGLIDDMKSVLITIHGTGEFDSLATKVDRNLLDTLQILKRDFIAKLISSPHSNKSLSDFLSRKTELDIEAHFIRISLAYLNCLFGYMYMKEPEFIEEYINKFD